MSDPDGTVIVVEHRDRLGCFATGRPAAVLAARGRRIVVVDDAEAADDLVGDMIEVLRGMCGRGGGRNRALRAVSATRRCDPVGVAGVLPRSDAIRGNARFIAK
jgi:putative resolvase